MNNQKQSIQKKKKCQFLELITFTGLNGQIPHLQCIFFIEVVLFPKETCGLYFKYALLKGIVSTNIYEKQSEKSVSA